MCIQRPITMVKHKNALSLSELREFKEVYCDENERIATILQTHLQHRMVEPILDVGAGLGDIAQAAFPHLRATLLDLHWAPTDNVLHERARGDFFDYVADPSDPPRTLLLCHVLQYLDDDIARLTSKVAEIDPAVIITVTNDNTGAFGELMNWSLAEIDGANPEFAVPFFDRGTYNLTERIPFVAEMSCPSFESLAQHFLQALIDAPASRTALAKLEKKLRSVLTEPEILIAQTVESNAKKT